MNSKFFVLLLLATCLPCLVSSKFLRPFLKKYLPFRGSFQLNDRIFKVDSDGSFRALWASEEEKTDSGDTRSGSEVATTTETDDFASDDLTTTVSSTFDNETSETPSTSTELISNTLELNSTTETPKPVSVRSSTVPDKTSSKVVEKVKTDKTNSEKKSVTPVVQSVKQEKLAQQKKSVKYEGFENADIQIKISQLNETTENLVPYEAPVLTTTGIVKGPTTKNSTTISAKTNSFSVKSPATQLSNLSSVARATLPSVTTATAQTTTALPLSNPKKLPLAISMSVPKAAVTTTTTSQPSAHEDAGWDVPVERIQGPTPMSVRVPSEKPQLFSRPIPTRYKPANFTQ